MKCIEPGYADGVRFSVRLFGQITLSDDTESICFDRLGLNDGKLKKAVVCLVPQESNTVMVS